MTTDSRNVLQLYPFQDADVTWFDVHRRAMVLYEMRLGKTVVSLNMMAKTAPSVVIIRCPQNALFVWRDHINTWWPFLTKDQDYEIRLMYQGVKGGAYAQDRANKWSAPRTKKTTFYICTYAAWIIDSPKIRGFFPSWLVNDEAKRLRSHKSKAYLAEKPWAAQARHGILFLEGTPTKRGPIDFYTMLSLIDPKRFGSYWNFNDHFYEKGVTVGGGEPFDVDTLMNLDHWYEILDRLARVRFRRDVRPEMPQTTRQLITVSMDSKQESLYRTLDEIRYAFNDSGGLILAQTTLEGLTRMRQILTCPKILGVDSYGQALTSFADMVDDMAPEERSHLVVFTAFKAAIPHFQEYLHSRGHRNIYRLHGDIDLEEGYRARQTFRANGGIMLCTSRYAEAFSLEPANACYHIGCEYDPNTNRQAEDRLVPQQGTNPIYSGYFTYEGTHDQRIIDILNGYQRVIDATLRATT